MSHYSLIKEKPYPHTQAEITLNLAFGTNRLGRSVYELRQKPPEYDLCWGIMAENQLIALIRYWEVRIDLPEYQNYRWLLLGPLAVIPEEKSKGYGKNLIAHSLALAKETCFDGVFVSGEQGYYQKLKFTPVPITSPENTPPNCWQIHYLKQNIPPFSADKKFKLLPV